MSLVHKTTWCFDCKSNPMIRTELIEKGKPAEAHYTCTSENCGAQHKIYFRPVNWRGSHHSYHWSNGEEIYY